jgi:hypothetical protein
MHRNVLHVKHTFETNDLLHSIVEGDEEDSDSGCDVGLPFHLRWQVMYANMKSEFLYKQISMFVAEYPSTAVFCDFLNWNKIICRKI